MKKNNRGFTLVELLAVIVILGLLMAIAIPSITKYITQSRIKTLTTTMDSYVTAIVNQVNNGEYKFSDSTKVFAVPIECVSLEKGGTNPFGNWYQANSNYWAYVLVHYDNVNYNYEYGFTFKDDAGYGLYPTINSKIENSMVRTGYDDLNQPKDGLATEFVSIDKWEGFNNINTSTRLEVLEASSEDEEGDGQYTCTLCQKGDNYDAIEEEKAVRGQKLSTAILKNNTVIPNKPTLTTTSEESNENGLYVSYETNNGNPTYYFRGKVTNNYVSFAGLTWRIVRINEDGTIRMIATNTEVVVQYRLYGNEYDRLYYSASDAKTEIDVWYQTNIIDKGYDSYVTTGSFCEQSKIKHENNYYTDKSTPVLYTNYTPNFKCETDGNGYGILTSKVGLMNYDEGMHAGGFYNKDNKSYYLYDRWGMWIMSPDCVDYSRYAYTWAMGEYGNIHYTYIFSKIHARPVINLNANVYTTGTGTSSDPYIIKTN